MQSDKDNVLEGKATEDNADHDLSSDEHSQEEQEQCQVMLNKMLHQQQMVNVNLLSNFFSQGDKNVCDALLEIKGSIDTNSRCLLKLHDLFEKLGGLKTVN